MEEQLDLAGAEAAVSTQQESVWAHRAELENFCLKTPRFSADRVISHTGPSICSLDQACMWVRYCTNIAPDIAAFFCNKVTSQGKSDLDLCFPRLAQLKSILNGLYQSDSFIQVLPNWLVQLVDLCQDTEKGFLLAGVSCNLSVGLQESDVIDLLLKKLFASSYNKIQKMETV